MKNLLFAVFLIVFCESVFAEEAKLTHSPKQAVGLSLGWVVANGLSYRRYFGTQFVQGTFAGSINKDEDKEYVDASISYGNYLNRFDLNKGQFPMGLKFIAGIEVERDTNRRADLVSQEENKSPNELHLGAGLGFDFGNPGRRGILFAMDFIYTGSFRGLSDLEFVRLGLLPSVSIQYNM